MGNENHLYNKVHTGVQAKVILDTHTHIQGLVIPSQIYTHYPWPGQPFTEFTPYAFIAIMIFMNDLHHQSNLKSHHSCQKVPPVHQLYLSGRLK